MPLAQPVAEQATPHVLGAPCWGNLALAHSLQLSKGVLTTVFALFLLILLQSWGDLGSCGSWALTGKITGGRRQMVPTAPELAGVTLAEKHAISGKVHHGAKGWGPLCR